MHKTRLLIGSVLVMLVACAKTKSEVRAAPAGIGIETEVLEAGAEPRERLRYRHATGLVEELEVELGLGTLIESTSAAAALEPPVLVLGLTMGPTSCAADGVCSAPLKFRVIDVAMPDGASEADAVAAAQAIAPLAEIGGVFELDDRGITRRADVVAPVEVSPRLLTLLGNIRTSLIAVPLPEEAIGVGARWQVRRMHQVGPIQTSQVLVYSLLERKGRTLRLALNLHQSAAPQKVALDASTNFHVDAYEISGAGSMLLSLDALIPLSEIRATSELRGSLERGLSSEPFRATGVVEVMVAPTDSKPGT
jgi:hypothetical protein